MKAFFETDLMAATDPECGHAFAGDFNVKIEDVDRQFSWQEDYDNVFQEASHLKQVPLHRDILEEDSFFCGEQEGLDLMLKYSQLTKRKPIESMKKKVIGHNSRS